MTSCVALVVAAGRGTRLGVPLPKQYLPLAGEPLLRHTLRALASHQRISGVLAVIHPDDRAHYDEAAWGLELLPPVPGGAQRQDSVRLGLESLVGTNPDVVAIHDGARPFVDAALIDRVLDAVGRAPGAIPALPVADTIKRGRDGWIVATVARSQLWRAQTPQAFRFREILAAHRAALGLELSDDAAVAERSGLAISLVMGSETNLKVTTPDDLARAESVLLARFGDVRTGQGFDVHPLGSGDHVWLCGIKVPHDRALIGHSDADVGLHAITDAILGALGAGDIGQHFPPSEPRWQGAASDQFLRHAAALVTKRGGRIAHVDVTLICERPKVSPHRQAMIARIAEILGLAPDRISVKATTTEKLGFTGREEGIAAQAIATLRLPGGF
ncbi:MAG TPA: bifunctional 2-C-methyl-D-erythritol 4-phosphate cytidylyltransferase/2-C-methyl-D-erythritol 2,4-cyclodiphosphate synthase [Stellaceae bacterium]|jgi:2-C-methyl-D-erythritol 4-phosphate cytidylyltransferase/2-C-methyl-D-erythritol 2,4-cyclodiphosphate synthase|nr:bifunctional 2-C-methyl-D-erythritol 4-phosphate cytidylyltransferase/2-C-methyl-D-erythritol 2,4-cyclodiphosphate synthase [Stellaceae bacterium]